MSYLGLSPYDLYKRDRNETLDMYTRQELSRDEGVLNLNERMEEVIRSRKYRNQPIEGKRLMLSSATRNIIKQAKCGIVVKPGNSKYLAREIEKLYFTNKIKRIQIGSNAKKYSNKYFLKSEIMRLLIKLIEKYAKK